MNGNRTGSKRVSLPTVALMVLALLCGGLQLADAQNYVWITIAGQAGVFDGVDGVGTNALFNQPSGGALDTAGNFYVTDEYNDAIRKITPDGTVTTFAGTLGVVGTNDGPANVALFTQPTNLILDNSNNLYVVDTYGYTVRKITPSGVVSTLAGKGNAHGSADGTGSQARFYEPNGICYDPIDNVFYIADGQNGIIRKMTMNGTVSSITNSYFYGVEQVAVDANHRLYVCDAYNSCIKTMDTNGNNLTVLAGANQYFPAGTNRTDGVGMAARFNFPESIWLNANGSALFVADYGNNEIRKVTTTANGLNGVVTTIGGNGTIGSRDGTNTHAEFNLMEGACVDPYGNVYVTDTQNSTIRIGYAGPPAIVNPPQNLNVGAGSSASFSVTAGGAAPRSAYQWRFNGVPLSNGTHISGALSNILTIISVTTNDVGTYQVTVTNAAGATNVSASLTVTITRTNPVITWASPAPITYGVALGGSQLDATANVPGSFVYTPPAGTVLKPGTNVLTTVFSPSDTSDYNSATSSVSLVVHPATLTVTANDEGRRYGDTNPVFTANYSGFVNGEVLATSDVSGSPLLTTLATSASAVGSYAISNNLGTLGSTDYSFSLVNGTLTVTQAALTVTASDATKVFGQTKTFTGTEFIAGGLLGSDSVTHVTLTSSGAPSTASVGSYSIIPSAATGSGLGNYAIAYVNGNLDVTRATPAITWTNPLPITYGVSLSATQLDAGASVPGLFIYAPTAGTVLKAGTNVLTTVFSPSDTSDYDSATTSVSLVVFPATLTVTASDAARQYGTTNPVFTANYSGFVNGEVLVTSDVSGSPLLTTLATTTSSVGAYAISNNLGTLASTNYSFALVDGTLTVTQASLTITANDETKVFGQAKTFAGTEFGTVGLLGADSVSQVTLTSLGAPSAAPVGDYPIIPSAAVGSGLDNYAIAYVNGNLIVTNGTPLTINSLLLPDGTILLSFTGGDAGVSYRIQAKTDSLLSPWSDLNTNQAGAGGLPNFIDLDATNHAVRFYRTVAP